MPKSGFIGAALTALFVLLAVFSEQVAPYPADQTHYARVLSEPSHGHWMGTDHLGRDLLSRLITGTRTTLGLAATVASINALIALIVGGLCGFVAGRLDALVMRLVDALLALPGFLLAVCFLGLFGGGSIHLVLYLVLTGWASLARVVRNEVAVVRQLDYITANRSVGYSVPRNLFGHALPAVLPSLLILLLNALIGDVFAIVSLSFLGLGLSPQLPEWGIVLFDARSFFLTSPWLFVFPCLFIATFTLGLHLLADGLRDAFDAKRALFATDEVRLLAGNASICGSDTP